MKSIIERLLPYRAPALWAAHAVQVALAYLLAFYIDPKFLTTEAQRIGRLVYIVFEGLWRYVSMRDMRCGFELGPNGREAPAVIYFA